MPVRRPVLSALAGVGTAVLATGLVAAPAQAAPVSIRVLTINDFHGRLLEDASGGPGAVALAGAVQTLSADQPTAFVSAGDNVGATPFESAVQEDAPTLAALNAMGLDLSAVGNHEFDRGYDWLVDPATHGIDGGEASLAGWPTLGANVEGEEPEMAPSEVLDIEGVQVGFVGVVTEQTASLVSPDGILGISFSDPAGAANAAAEALTDGDEANGEAQVLVLLAHEGSPSALVDPASCESLTTGGNAFADLVSGLSADFDAVVGGHTHLAVDCDVPREGGVSLPVIEATAYGNAIGQLDFTVETTTGEVTAAAGTVLSVEVGACPAPADGVVAGIVTAAEADAEVVGAEVIGTITADVTRALVEVNGEIEDDRGTESVLGNFIADVQLDATAAPELGGAQIAFMNPGGLRDDLFVAPSGDEAAGEVTYAEAATVQPFANGIVTLTLTGEQVRQVLEQQWQPAGSSRPFLALGVSEGFSYTYAPDAPQGNRIVSVTLAGEELVPAAEYRVTVNSFLAAGGDNFSVLAEGTDRQDNGFNDLNVLVDYLGANSPVTADTEPRRAVTTAGPTPGEPAPVDPTVPTEPADVTLPVACAAEPAPAPSPTPSPSAPAPTTGGGAGGGSNPGLKVDTGRTDALAPAAAPVAVLGLLLLAGAGGAVVVARRTRGQH